MDYRSCSCPPAPLRRFSGAEYFGEPRSQAVHRVLNQDGDLFTKTVAHARVSWSGAESARRQASLLRENLIPETIVAFDTGARVGAAMGVLATLMLAVRFRLSDAEKLDSAPVTWPAMVSPFHAMHHHGSGPGLDDDPVLVTITYEVEASNAAAFVDVMRDTGKHRRRYGAMQWGFYRDMDHPERYVEVFMAAWAEHLRQGERPTQDDLRAWDAVCPLFRELRVQHFVVPSAWEGVVAQRRPHSEHSKEEAVDDELKSGGIAVRDLRAHPESIQVQGPP
jgi:hypothetical protein